MNATERLKAALAPLAERTMRRVERIKQLQAQPQTEQTIKAIAAEQREIALFKQAANEAATVLNVALALSRDEVRAANIRAERVQQVVEDASHYEQLFHTVIERAPQVATPLPDEKWPPAAAAAMRSMYLIELRKSDPAAFAAVFTPLHPALQLAA